MKKNITAIILSLILIVLIIGGFYVLKEYKEFKSDYILYLSALQKVSELYGPENNYEEVEKEYEKALSIESKYHQGIFNKAFKTIRVENNDVIEEIEKKRHEQKHRLQQKETKHQEQQREELERIEQECKKKEELARLEQKRVELEQKEREKIEQERIQLENNQRLEQLQIEMERHEQDRLKKEAKEKAERERLEKERFERELLEKELKEANATGKINGYYYVDLGLSVKWATCNVGATSPEEYGDYFSWGEIKSKYSYTMQNCLFLGKIIDDISGNPQYDVARYTRDYTWRLPTKTELNELKTKCEWNWIQYRDTNGYMVTGPNGNSIFIPAAGYKSKESLKRNGQQGNYWTSSPDNSRGDVSFYLRFNDNYVYEGWISRIDGFNIRPVTE